MFEIRKLTNHGGSAVVHIPSTLWRSAGWSMSDHIALTLMPDGAIILRRLTSPELPPPRLEQRA